MGHLGGRFVSRRITDDHTYAVPSDAQAHAYETPDETLMGIRSQAPNGSQWPGTAVSLRSGRTTSNVVVRQPGVGSSAAKAFPPTACLNSANERLWRSYGHERDESRLHTRHGDVQGHNHCTLCQPCSPRWAIDHFAPWFSSVGGCCGDDQVDTLVGVRPFVVRVLFGRQRRLATGLLIVTPVAQTGRHEPWARGDTHAPFPIAVD